MVKRICIVGLMIVSGVFAQVASATLPFSTYGEDNGWQGYKTYEENGFDCMLVFNVYDMAANPSEITWLGDVEFPQGDRYLYAYQLYSSELSTEDIGFFRILNIDGEEISQAVMRETQAVQDGEGTGVMTSPNPSPDNKQGQWTWAAGAFISATKHSAYLIFSSDKAPIKGSFEVKSSEETEPPVPEPTTFALLSGACGLYAITRRKKSQRR